MIIRRNAKKLLVILTIAVGLSGCEFMGYTEYVGTWVYSYEDVDMAGDPVTVTDTLTLSQSEFTAVTTTVDMAATETWEGLRGELLVIGNTFYFTTNEVGFDSATLTGFSDLLALEGQTFDLPVQEWYDLDAFLAEMAKSTMIELSAEDFDLGSQTFSISGTSMTITSQALTYTKQ
jgi:hypothetical protein